MSYSYRPALRQNRYIAKPAELKHPKKLAEYSPDEISQRTQQVLSRLQLQHKTLEELQRFLGEFRATNELLNLLVSKKKIELVDGRYRPYGWQSPGVSQRTANTRLGDF